MRTVEDIARILVETFKEEGSIKDWPKSKGILIHTIYFEDGEYYVEGDFNFITIVKKLQALGIIESSETE